MKNCVLLTLFLLSIFAQAQEKQEVSVEKNLISITLGLLNINFQNETRLDRKITFRSEIGLSTGNATNVNGVEKETSFLIVPLINLEPRWYYGLDRRSRLNKITKNNSSNYISLFTSFVAANAPLVNTKDFKVRPNFIIVPEYGIRRSGKHFYSEYSAGVGFKKNFSQKGYYYIADKNEMAIDFQYKLGFIF